MPVIIDELDKRILGELQNDGRTPLAKLADDIGKPRTTIMNRVQKLRGA
jgi:Transcriptional regulators